MLLRLLAVLEMHFFVDSRWKKRSHASNFVCGQRRNLATLVGRAGMGKSALLSYLVSHPPRIESTAAQDVCAVSMMGLAAGELPMEFARKLSGRRVMNATEGWSSLSDCFNSCMRGDASCLLLIDDVECCTAEAEGDLVRMVRAASDSHISVILAIESHLASTVSRWLMERSYLQIELPPWDLEQTDDFCDLAWLVAVDAAKCLLPRQFSDCTNCRKGLRGD